MSVYMPQKSLNDLLHDVSNNASENFPLPGQDRIFVRQLKKGGKYGYIKFEDSVNKHYIVYNIRNEVITEYDSIQELENDEWVLD